MDKNVTVTPDHEITTLPTKAFPQSKHTSPKKNGDQASYEKKRRKFKALQEVLQDPVTVCEGS